MSTQNLAETSHIKKTTVNRFLLFIIIGFTTAVPLIVFNGLLVAWWSFFLTPLITFLTLIFLSRRERRISDVKPGWLEFFFASLGAFYPSVLVAIVMWFFWWILFGLAVLFGLGGELDGPADILSTIFYNFLSLIIALFLTIINWRHVINQLYPDVGSRSAFAEVSATGKLWLLRRGVLLFVIFIALLIVYVSVTAKMGSEPGIALELSFGAFFVLVYLFFISITAWLWLRQPEPPRGLDFTNQALARFLQPFGYQVQPLAAIKNSSTQAVDISDQMTASVDLIARKENRSLVIDVMTAEETHHAPDWVIASEFRMAVWYLKNVLQLPPPVEAVAVLVDVAADESMVRFAEDQNISVVELSNNEVVGLMTEDFNNSMIRTIFAAKFDPLFGDFANGSATKVVGTEEGGRHD